MKETTVKKLYIILLILMYINFSLIIIASERLENAILESNVEEVKLALEETKLTLNDKLKYLDLADEVKRNRYHTPRLYLQPIKISLGYTIVATSALLCLFELSSDIKPLLNFWSKRANYKYPIEDFVVLSVSTIAGFYLMGRGFSELLQNAINERQKYLDARKIKQLIYSAPPLFDKCAFLCA